MRLLLVVMILGCGGTASVEPTASTAPDPAPGGLTAVAPKPDPLPAGLYFQEDPGLVSCFDCATPRAAVALPFDGALPERGLAPGYPRVMTIGGRPMAVLGFFRTEADARRWSDDVIALPAPPLESPDWDAGTEWIQADPFEGAQAYRQEDLRPWIEHGGSLDELEAEPVCTVAPGTVWRVPAEERTTTLGNFLSVPYRCGDEEALVPKELTLLDATVRVLDGAVEKTQMIFAECGDVSYRRVRWEDGERVARESFSMGPGCVGSNALAERARRACPHGTVESCVAAGRAHGAEDPRRARVLLEQACDMESSEGCRELAFLLADAGSADLQRAIHVVRHHCRSGDERSCAATDPIVDRAAAAASGGADGALRALCALREIDDSMEDVSERACGALTAS